MRRAHCGFVPLLFTFISCKPIAAPDVVSCASSSDCASWEQCVSGTCLRVQSEETKKNRCANVRCDSGAWCERESGQCKTGPQPCDESADCTGEKTLCDRLFGVCRACLADTDCELGWSC